ncbi:MAG TPA: alpha/beta fold hydrolase [Myxococcales bacterium]|nr:alpha/beta fold hydrolase [Myxococcales bacterium]
MIQTTAAGRKFVRTPDTCFANLEGYDFAPHYVEVDGLRVHYVDEGPADGEPVLMLHGQPTWSYLYRKMIGPVASAGYRVIVPDLIGMGKSDKPTDPNSHTFEQQVSWVLEFIEALGLEEIALVCQDWGGAIGLRLVGDRPELFSRVFAANALAVRTGMGVGPISVPRLRDRSAYPLDPNARLRHWDDFLGEAIALIGEDMSDFFWAWVQFALTAPDFLPSQNVDTGRQTPLTAGEIAAYDAPFPEDIYRTGPRTFPSMLADVDDELNARAWEGLGRFDRPLLTVCGESDPLVGTKRNQNTLTAQVPGAKGQPHARIDAGHFIQENAGELLAQHLVDFLKSNPLG